jgi:hypothetical protein
MLKYVWICLSLAIFVCPLAAADKGLGESLEKQMWDNIKARNWTAVEKNIARDFQSVHEDGARSRDQEIDLLKKLNLGNYQITSLKTTEQGGVIIVTYNVAVGENIDAKRLSSNPHPRLSVWKNNSGVWQWVAHANLSPI